jgi:hypothetical protein
MTLETFFEKFDQFADAPNAVAKMRELVLQLALNGSVIGLDSSKWERVSRCVTGWKRNTKSAKKNTPHSLARHYSALPPRSPRPT